VSVIKIKKYKTCKNTIKTGVIFLAFPSHSKEMESNKEAAAKMKIL
jgi:hypothetical protein